MQASQAKTFIIKLSNILNRFNGQTNVRAITAVNAIGLANEQALATRALFRLVFVLEIIAEHKNSPVKNQPSNGPCSVFQQACLS